MRLHTEWLSYLRALRRREVELAFRWCPPGVFANALELGAGDGYQASLLARYASRLVSTDYDRSILSRAATPSVQFMVCDAEQLERYFKPRQFDLVFSSNVMEHLPDPGRALAGISRVVTDEGITIHVMPTRFWKLCHVALHIPHVLARALERTSDEGLAKTLARERAKGTDPEQSGSLGPANNPKTARRVRSLLSRLLSPDPHGVSATHTMEFRAFGKERWIREFAAAGLDVVAVLKGPVCSGYGFGLDRFRLMLEKAGFASEYAYVAVKRGAKSPWAHHFQGA